MSPATRRVSSRRLSYGMCSDAECKASCHCEPGGCTSDLANGEVCDENSDCQSGYCVGATAATTMGRIRRVVVSRPTVRHLSRPLLRIDANTCQGERTDATCTSNVCGSTTLDDDTACSGTTLSKDCSAEGCANRFCNGLLRRSSLHVAPVSMMRAVIMVSHATV